MNNFRGCPAVGALARWRRFVLLLGATVAMGWLIAVPRLLADEPKREIFVPVEELDELLAGPTRRVLLTDQQYRELLQQAEPIDESPEAPQAVVVATADYQITLAGERAEIRGVLELEVLTDGLHATSLAYYGIGLRQALLDGQPAAIGFDPAASPPARLFVSGRGRHRLELNLVARVVATAAQQSLDIRLPQATAETLSLIVPGDVDVRSGNSVIRRRHDERAAVTRFDLLSQQGRVDVALSLNNLQQQQQRLVLARSVMVQEVTAAYQRIHATVSLEVLHRPTDEFRFALPAGFELTDVATPQLARWNVEQQNDRRVARIVLRQAETGRVVLNLSATRVGPPADDWTAAQLEPLDVASQVSVVGLLVEDRLEAQTISAEGLLPIDNDVLTAALPASVFAFDPGAPRVRTVAAYYAPAADWSLAASFITPPAKLLARSYLDLVAADTQLRLVGVLELTSQAETQFSFDLRVPEGWQLLSLALADGTALEHERYPLDEGGLRVQVQVPQGLRQNQPQVVHFVARSVPVGWLDAWTTFELELPVFSVLTADEQTGAVAVRTRDDLAARPAALTGLTVMDAHQRAAAGMVDEPHLQAYRFDNDQYAATFALSRMMPRVSARGFSFFHLSSEGLTAHYELLFQVDRARTRRLAFSLPETTPEAVSIAVADGVAVEDTASRVEEGRRVWTIMLAERRHGQVRVLVDFRADLPAEPDRLSLPVVRAEQVAHQSGLIAVEGAADLDVEVVAHPRRADVGELAEADYDPGARLLGAYAFAGEPAELSVSVARRPQFGMFAALVQLARYTTFLGADGQCVTEADFQLRSTQPYLIVQLPVGAELWSATLDGTPVQPQLQGDHLLVSMTETSGTRLATLVVVYATRVKAIGHLGHTEISAARLFLPAASGDPLEVPVADVRWWLQPPRGYRLLRSDGTVAPIGEQAVAHRLAAVQVAGLLYQMSGGVGGVHFARGRFAAPAETAWYDVEAEMSGSTSFVDADLNDEMGRFDAKREEFDQRPMASPAEAVSKAAEMPAAPPPSSAPESALKNAAKPSAAGEGQAQPLPGAKDAEELADLQIPGRPPVKKQAGAYRALAGLRSLEIRLTRAGDEWEFQGLGLERAEPRLQVTLADGARLRYLAWALALLVLGVGFALTRARLAVKFWYVVLVALVATLVPLASGWFALVDVLNGAFFAACLLIPYYLIAGLCCWCGRVCGATCCRLWACCVPSRAGNQSATSAGALMLAALIGGAALAAEPVAPATPRAPVVVQVIDPLPPLTLPGDAVIRLYDATSGQPPAEGNQVLLPYERYLELYRRAHPDAYQTPPDPPAPYAPAGAVYSAKLTGDTDLLIEGRIALELFVDEFVEVPLLFAGGVLAEARLDGQPARLQVLSADSPVAGPQATTPTNQALQKNVAPRQLAVAPAERGTLLVLHVAGKGRHELLLKFRLAIQREGGWRRVAGRLPNVPAAEVVLEVATPATDVRTGELPDAPSHETQAAGETIRAVLGAGGQIAWAWRPRLEAAQVDQTLTATSDALLDVREDGLQLAWRLSLEFRSQREAFTVALPEGFVVKQVAGDNVRGWKVRDAIDGAAPMLEIELLAAALEREQFTIHLQRPLPLGLQGGAFTAPVLRLVDAALETGRYLIRRGSALDLATTSAVGLSRIDVDNDEIARLAPDEPNPMGLVAYEAYRFVATTFSLEVSVQPLQPEVTARLQTVLRIAELERSVETRVVLEVHKRPLHQIAILLPAGFLPNPPVAAGRFEWSLTEEQGRQRLTIHFAEGQTAETTLLLSGRLGPREAVEEVALPGFAVLDVVRQTQEMAVVVDPAFDVQPLDLLGAEPVLLGRIARWLQAEQQSLARLALDCRGADYSGRLRLVPRQAVVRCQTVSNVRVTDRLIEETILLDFTITGAGIREVVFQLPAHLADAQIETPQLRLKTVEPVGDGDDAPVRVRLELQDDVMGQLRVLVQHDRARVGEVQYAPLPLVETGQLENRYVSLESSAREELVVVEAVGLEPLARQQNSWQLVAELLRGGSTMAYRVQPSADQPRLRYEMRQRAVVVTSGARIELSLVKLAYDRNGAFRAIQSYRMFNTTEQFLEIELPVGAALWTAVVAGQPVKPAAVPGAGSHLARIPLVKTAAGDLNYEVVLVYAGRGAPLGWSARVDFPMIRTRNVNVELSQVELYLPDDYRWYRFDGTMGPQRDEQELVVGELGYWTREVARLSEALASQDDYTRTRARSNLDILQQQIDAFVSANTYTGASRAADGELRHRDGQLSEQLRENAATLEMAQSLARQQQVASPLPSLGNSTYLGMEFRQQDNRRARNVVTELQWNFAPPAAEPSAAPVAPPAQRFNTDWLVTNGLIEFDLINNKRIDLSELSERRKSRLVEQAEPSADRALSREAVALDKAGKYTFSGSEELRRAAGPLPAQRDEASGRALDTQVEVGERNVFEKGAALAVDVSAGEQKPADEAVDRYRQRLEQRQQHAQPQESVPHGTLGESLDATTWTAVLVEPTGLASLEVDIPLRGQVYRFSTPRGDVQITASAVARPVVDGGQRVLFVLAVTALVLLVYRAIVSERFWQFALSPVTLLAVGMCCLVLLCAGIFPVAALLLLVLTAAALIARWLRVPLGWAWSAGAD